MTRPGEPSATTRSREVVLVYPLTGIDVPGVSVFLPLSVLFLAASLRHEGVPCRVIDMRVDTGWRESLAVVTRNHPRYVGISSMTGKQIHWGLKAAKLVREIDSSVPIVWGGTHPSVLPEETLKHDLVDAVVRGQGEGPAVVIAKYLQDNTGSVNGKIYAEPTPAGGVRLEGPCQFDFNELDIEPYLTPIVRDVRGLAHVTSRGCPHKCSYCYNKAVHGSTWVADPAEAVVDHLERLSRMGVSGVMLFEDNFFVNRARVEAIAKGILDRGLKLAIKADCRADYIARYSRDFLSLIRRAGFELLYIGAESGSDRVLEGVHKGVDVSTVHRANRRLAEADIRPHYSFMAGLPGETVEDMRATVRMMVALKKEHPGAYLSPVKAYVPYPGTDLFEAAVEAGFEPPEALEGWSAYDWNNRPAPWLSREETRFVQKMTYVTAGLDPSIIELSGIDQSRFATWGYLRFARLCQKRSQKRNLGFIPELPIVTLVKRFISS